MACLIEVPFVLRKLRRIPKLETSGCGKILFQKCLKIVPEFLNGCPGRFCTLEKIRRKTMFFIDMFQLLSEFRRMCRKCFFESFRHGKGKRNEEEGLTIKKPSCGTETEKQQEKPADTPDRRFSPVLNGVNRFPEKRMVQHSFYLWDPVRLFSSGFL